MPAITEQNNASTTFDNPTETFRDTLTASMINNDEERLARMNDKLLSVTVSVSIRLL